MKGPSVQFVGDQILEGLAIFASTPFRALAKLVTDCRQWHPTNLMKLPYPDFSEGKKRSLSELADLLLKRTMLELSTDETSSFFAQPFKERLQISDQNLITAERQIDELVADSYGTDVSEFRELDELLSAAGSDSNTGTPGSGIGSTLTKPASGIKGHVAAGADLKTALFDVDGEDAADLAAEGAGPHPLSDTVRLTAGVAQIEPGKDGMRVAVYNDANKDAAAFTGLSYYDYDPAFVVEAKFEPAAKLEPKVFQTSRGWYKQFYYAGDAVFTLKGVAVRLPMYAGSDKPDEIDSLAAFIMERPDVVKLSLRSKGDLPVNEFLAAHFNGGGHANAAGGQSKEPLQAVVDRFLREVPAFLAKHPA